MLERLSDESRAVLEGLQSLPARERDLFLSSGVAPGWRSGVAWFIRRPRAVHAVHYLYYLSIALMVGALVPQIVQVARMRAALAVSILWVIMSLINYGFRLVYFLQIKSAPGFAFCVSMMVLFTVLLALVVQYTYVSTTHITEEDSAQRCGGL